MIYLIKEISQINKTQIKNSSYFNNFPGVSRYYFQIPDGLDNSEIDHLVKLGRQFFESQFLQFNKNETQIFVDQKIIPNDQFTHQIPWEFFYQFQSPIKVRSNVYDDYLGWDISGFCGNIINFFTDENEDVYQIQLSLDSVKQIPIEKLEKIATKRSPFFTYLESDLIIPDFQTVNNSIPISFLIDFLPKLVKEESVKKFLFDHLQRTKNHDNFFFEWELSFLRLISQETEIITTLADHKSYHLIGIHGSDEFYGVWGEFAREEMSYLFPMIEIKQIRNNENFNDLFQAYRNISRLILPN